MENKIRKIENYAKSLRIKKFAHGFDHTDRVRNWILKIAEAEKYPNPDLAEAAALLHDIGRSEPDKGDHGEIGAQIAQDFLIKNNLFSNKENEEIRREQINGILAAEPAIIIGDFNSFPDGSVIAALRAHRYKEYRDYTNYSIDSPYSFTTMKYRGNPIELYKAVSDYIFYRLPGWIVYELRKMPREHEFPTGMPSPTCPSDHLMLYGEFRKLRVEIYNW